LADGDLQVTFETTVSTRFPVTISPTGTITATIEPSDVPAALDKVISTMREAGDGIVVEAPCQSAEDRHVLAKRLAEMFLREIR
jgi:hypothetical protein